MAVDGNGSHHVYDSQDRSIGGMSLRDYFAAHALQGLCANAAFNEVHCKLVAAIAYDQADAMLAARKGGVA